MTPKHLVIVLDIGKVGVEAAINISMYWYGVEVSM